MSPKFENRVRKGIAGFAFFMTVAICAAVGEHAYASESNIGKATEYGEEERGKDAESDGEEHSKSKEYGEESSSESESDGVKKMQLSEQQDLMNWIYGSGEWENQSEKTAILKENIRIHGDIFIKTDEKRSLNTDGHLLVVGTGSTLTIDGANVELTGKGKGIRVEKGGRLFLKRGEVNTLADQVFIDVRKGAKCTLYDEFHMTGKISYANAADDPSDAGMPPIEPTKPEHGDNSTQPVRPLYPIVNLFGREESVVCAQGTPPKASDYPASVKVAYETEAGVYAHMEVPVKWDISKVKFNRSGVYRVSGTFSEDELARRDLFNPLGIKAKLLILVRSAGAVDSLTGAGIVISENGWTSVRLRMPQLPTDATAIRVYRSVNGTDWQIVSKNRLKSWVQPGDAYNFLDHSVSIPPYQYVTCQFLTDYQPVWFRVAIEGSVFEGMSNSVKFQEPGDAEKGEALYAWGALEDVGAGGSPFGMGGEGGSDLQDGDNHSSGGSVGALAPVLGSEGADEGDEGIIRRGGALPGSDSQSWPNEGNTAMAGLVSETKADALTPSRKEATEADADADAQNSSAINEGELSNGEMLSLLPEEGVISEPAGQDDTVGLEQSNGRFLIAAVIVISIAGGVGLLVVKRKKEHGN